LTDNVVFNIGLLLVLAGFAIGILAVIVAVLRSARGSGPTRGGGVIMIGPLPIVFGTDKESTRTLILLAIILMAAALLFTFLQTVWR
jgi:uncharacterized protein (TIGR00304 family)